MCYVGSTAAACGGQVGHGNRFVKIGGGDPNSDQSPLTPRVQQKELLAAETEAAPLTGS